MSVLDTIASRSPNLTWIKRTILLVRHGSMAYGTNIEGSDEDFKGVTIPPKEYFLGSTDTFEQIEIKDPDCTIFDIRKFFRLAADCNPALLEILFADPSDILFVSTIGEELLSNRDKFLSKASKFRFCGYAIGQLRRLKLHRAYLLNPITEPPTRKEFGLPEHTVIPKDQLAAAEAEINKVLTKYDFDFIEGASEGEKIELKLIISSMMAELKLTSEHQFVSAARRTGLDDNFIQLMQLERQYSTKKKQWEQYQNWEKTRNPKRFELEKKFKMDTKNLGHIVRLLRMAKEILTQGKVIVRRPDYEELIAIRNGAWTYEQAIEWAEKMVVEIDELYKTCTILPKFPDRDFLDKLCIKLVEQSLKA